ncbi:MAG: DUF1501 domain-containing protein [Luteolibacter sp.]|uniref:DUF1501 domain-containing protein n=1 Tax=Luteolibacter sp. TaxID=1962973 RepID=UPI003267981B
MKSDLYRLNEVSRRAFVERLAQAAFGISLLPFIPGGKLFAEESASPAPVTSGGPGFGRAKAVIMLQLSGGLSQIDSFDPKTGDSKGPGEALGTKADFQVSSFLPETAKIADKITVIRSMTAKVGVHEQARYLMRTGFEQRGTIVHPTLGAWAQHYLGPSHQTLPSSACINRPSNHGNGFFPATMSPLPILDPDEGLKNAVSHADAATMQKRLTLLNEMDRQFTATAKDPNVAAYNDFYESSLRLMKGKDLECFDLNKESTPLREKYGKNRFGQGCLLARRLVEGGVRFVEVESGGWDMHKDIKGGMEDRGTEFDTAFAALISDLDSRGLLDSVMVVVATEFGRKPQFDGSGRGHHPIVFSSVIAGGGAKRGYVHGASDAAGGHVERDPVTVGDLHATVAHACGLPIATPVISPSGRPFTIGNKGKPVVSLFT